MNTTKKQAMIIASLRSDALSVKIGAAPAENFIRAYNAARALGVEIPANLVAFRASL